MIDPKGQRDSRTGGRRGALGIYMAVKCPDRRAAGESERPVCQASEGLATAQNLASCRTCALMLLAMLLPRSAPELQSPNGSGGAVRTRGFPPRLVCRSAAVGRC